MIVRTACMLSCPVVSDPKTTAALGSAAASSSGVVESCTTAVDAADLFESSRARSSAGEEEDGTQGCSTAASGSAEDGGAETPERIMYARFEAKPPAAILCRVEQKAETPRKARQQIWHGQWHGQWQHDQRVGRRDEDI